MELEIGLRWLHIIGAAVLLGTGAGIAFFMLMAHRTRDPVLIAHTGAIVVIADYLFTALAIVLQPITGVLLAREVGWPLSEGWIVVSAVLYVFIGLFWLPIVWIQMRMRDMAREAVGRQEPLPSQYHALFKTWFSFGFPAFFMLLAIIWLMLARPSLVLFR